MKKIAVILAGCGHQDGSEIRESVLTLLELDKYNVKVAIFAPNVKQYDVINHLDGSVMNESRNLLVEAARIARGEISALDKLKSKDFDALIIPGGYGVAKNLADIAQKGEKGEAIPEVKNIINDFIREKKPIGAICIAPVVVAQAVKGSYKVKLTLGEENNLLTAFSAEQEVCPTESCVYDEKNKIVSTPAYMRNERISRVARGIEQLVKKVVEIC
ncbi:isoprenoid biosynthesis protein [endosymbiont of Acanthamoeba sp. UWC8]|uniref:isoprenoid biosynthesis glyoxalase ElbB n=1 Tax=endosymbiont of Acanthamoeba sp. UWC8 TaxID=86106 RepID=UPI0004D16E69|nr:isoprenoid biosynthesis glyoxalase ElbB [endosymbiont of Acanthamoeba sp. UWC8]AIF81310.1 isoprenoid biosynthesis protein [endosymbiont of Acanthamoeba sp. UWC8]